MTFTHRGALALCAAFLAAGPALAQSAPAPATPPPAAGGPMRADPFGDAAIARTAAAAAAAARFIKLDTDRDGAVSAAEIAASRQSREGQRRGRWPGGGRGRSMERMGDANGDGRLVSDEYIAGSLRRFDLMDADRDGQLTKAEREAARAAMRARMEQRMAAMAQGQLEDNAPDGGD